MPDGDAGNHFLLSGPNPMASPQFRAPSRKHYLALCFLGMMTGAPTWAQALPGLEPPDIPTANTAREVELEQRIRQLESMVETLSSRMETISTPATPSAELPAAGDSAGSPGVPSGPSPPGAGGLDSNAGEGDVVGFGGAAGPSPAAPAPTARFQMPPPVPDIPMKVRFGPGFEMRTADDEYTFQFHDLTQVDGRFFNQDNQLTTKDTFVIPRQWFIFSGRLTKPFEYYVSLAEGFDSVNILDAFLNIHYDDRLQLKIGRYKTPFTYEFYALPIQGLITPERSLFFNNFGLNRDIGLMGWGQLFEKRIDYAAGIFNGTRNGFLDANDAKDVAAFINFRPWGTSKGSILENFNFGGSLEYGRQQNIPIPQTFRTNVATTGNQAVGVPFLSFNRNVTESGERALWSLHTAWYYNHTSLIAEWQSGFQDYALAGRLANKVNLPIESFYVQGGYLVTGETVSSRGTVLPLRPFDLRRGKVGPGAVELAGRYDLLNFGNNVFTQGLADPNLWTSSLYTVDLGVNWYWNAYIKWAFLWEHAVFGNPVLVQPGELQKTSDLFQFRCQVWF